MLVFLLINVYLFVIFKGVKNLREIKAEHLLTRSDCYRALYVTAPVMGGLAGCIATLAASSTVGQSARVAALATVGTTFVIWIVLDPVTTLLETFLSSASRRHRLERLAQAKTSHEVSIREESFG
jgi:ACR3 family arsenite efflux pump ArsB